MCVIIVSNKPFENQKEKILKACEQNRDGWGLVILASLSSSPERLLVDRGMNDGEGAFRDGQMLFSKVKDDASPWWVFHARMTSAGHSRFSNLHPFAINDTHLLFHNGTLSMGRGSLCAVDSDTKQLAEILSTARLSTDDMVKILTEIQHQRFALVDQSTRVVHMVGDWKKVDDNEWHSNNSLIWTNGFTHHHFLNRTQVFTGGEKSDNKAVELMLEEKKPSKKQAKRMRREQARLDSAPQGVVDQLIEEYEQQEEFMRDWGL